MARWHVNRQYRELFRSPALGHSSPAYGVGELAIQVTYFPHEPVPFLGAYRSSKAAVSAIGESLQAEVAQFGIRVLEIMPGPIETDMLIASDKPSPAIEHELYRGQAEQMWEGRQRIRDMYTSPAEAARRIADAILDDNAPLRAGCDDMSEGMLTAWRNSASDEAWMRPLLQSFTEISTTGPK